MADAKPDAVERAFIEIMGRVDLPDQDSPAYESWLVRESYNAALEAAAVDMESQADEHGCVVDMASDLATRIRALKSET